MNTMKKRLGLEAIAFQSKNFGKELELNIEVLRAQNLTIDQANKSKYRKNLDDTIRKYTNLNIYIYFVPYDENAINVNILNINSGINGTGVDVTEKELANFGEYVKKRGKQAKFSANLKTGKVDGFYSQVQQPMVLDYNGFVNNPRYTPAEVVSTILHEVGHAFTQLEYSNRIVSTNQALAAIFYSISKDNPPDKHLGYLRSASTVMGLNPSALDDIVDVKNNTIISSIIVDRGILNIKSELGTHFYDSVSIEYLADQYMARYGYSAHFASRLNKYYQGSTHKSALTRTIARLLELIGTLIVGFTALGIFTISAIAAFIYLGAVTAMLIAGEGISIKRMTYDNIIVRYKRLNEQVIERLKNNKLAKEEVKQLIADYNKVKEIIEKTKDFKPIYQKVFDFMIKTRRDGIAAMQLQRELEELASSDLFVKSAQLKVLAS